MAYYTRLILLSSFCLLAYAPASAQPFEDCATSSLNATVIVPGEVETGTGDALEAGDTIALFTSDGDCVGRGRWDGTHLSIAVTSADAQGSAGYEAGNWLRFKIWDASEQTVLQAQVTYLPCGPGTSPLCRSRGRYARDAVYRLASLTAGAAQLKKDASFVLSGAFPNPFRRLTRFTLKVARDQHVTIELYNVLGQRLRSLYDGPVEAGRTYTFSLESQGLPSGLYFYRVRGETFADVRRVVLTK